MSHEVRLTPRARRDLDRLPLPVAQALVELLAGPVAENPRRIGKPLRLQLAGRFSARRGDYRVIHTIDDEARVVLVVTLGHRRDAHR